MNGGKLTEKISFFDNTEVSDGAGGSIATPVLVLETWCSFQPVRSVKTLEALKDGLNRAYQIKIRKRSGFEVKSFYTVMVDGKEMVILAIEDRDNETILTAMHRED